MEFDKVKDSGARQEFGTGSVRDTQKGKGRFDLIPTLPMRRLARHYENGAVKYGDRNWEKGQPLMRYLDSAERHLNMLKSGDLSEDHAAAIAWNVFGYMHTLAMIEAGKLPKTLDNRPENIDAEFGVAAPKDLAATGG
jgi:dATP/dGTP diphosphohydrolase, N-terminal